MFKNCGKDTIRTLERLSAVLRFIDTEYDKLSNLDFMDVATTEQKAQLELIDKIYKVYSEF